MLNSAFSDRLEGSVMNDWIVRSAFCTDAKRWKICRMQKLNGARLMLYGDAHITGSEDDVAV